MTGSWRRAVTISKSALLSARPSITTPTSSRVWGGSGPAAAPNSRSSIGGLRIRTGDALTAWLEEGQAAGIIGFHTSLAGCGDIHDRWNGRAGDFDYQTSILKMAGERGMVRQEKLFLTQTREW